MSTNQISFHDIENMPLNTFYQDEIFERNFPGA